MTVATNERIDPIALAAGGAAAELRHLTWDSGFFGARMGTIAGISLQDAASQPEAGALVAAAIAAARDGGYDHVIARFDASAWGLVRAAEAEGMTLVDAGIDLSMAPRPATGATAARAAAARIRDAQPDDLAWAQEFAASAFEHSRFWADPFFGDDAARAFHRAWVQNLWRGLAQRVFVAETAEGAPLAFNACGLNDDGGRIILIGSERGQRRSGIGRALVEAAIGWFHEQGAARAFVKTQLGNVPALRLYEAAGFSVHTTELTYSWAREGKSV